MSRTYLTWTNANPAKYNHDGTLSVESLKNGVTEVREISNKFGRPRFSIMLSARRFSAKDRRTNWLPYYYKVLIRDHRISDGNNTREFANFRSIKDARKAVILATVGYEMKLDILAREYSEAELNSMSPSWAKNSFKISTK